MNPSTRTPKLAFTCGDPAGIGPEVIEDWLARNPEAHHEVVVIGAESWLGTLPETVGKISVGPKNYVAEAGRPTPDGARVALAAMERAAQACADGDVGGVVTGPVSKIKLAEIGFPFPGQTEFFAQRWGGDPVMAFAGGRLRVVLLTWHIPLREVPGALSFERFERSVRAADALARCDGIATPRIGVCGLNPHAGEGGLIGHEERQQIDPILDRLRGAHPQLSRCQPGDTIFGRQLRGEFDVVIALYHDQGLAPLKTLEFEQSVNLTLGLPHVRTSPDHGTAYALAGKGQADGRSFANAVSFARRLLVFTRSPSRPST